MVRKGKFNGGNSMGLRSQAVRTLAPENDPLKMGMGWKVEDLAKPQIMVESTYGDSHPGSAHLNQFTEEAVKAVNENGVNGEPKTPEEMEQILADRRAKWQPKAPKYTRGLLKLYSQHAVSPMKGAYME